jgi:exopolyphosphatase/guanosine-5'-triphosphate,3'-diphosphate pyrophosphatase
MASKLNNERHPMRTSIEALLQSAHQIMMRLDPEPQHGLHVAKQAKKIALALCAHTPAQEIAWAILEAAALLHDIGWRLKPDGKGHHKASEQMILQETWPKKTRQWIPSVAAIARYHRKRGPRDTDQVYSRLNDKEKTRVRQLAGILRLADALDRGHEQRYEVKGLEIENRKARVKVYVRGPSGSQWNQVTKAWNKKNDLAEAYWAMPWILQKA